MSKPFRGYPVGRVQGRQGPQGVPGLGKGEMVARLPPDKVMRGTIEDGITAD
jgi:hypothetical protein